MGGRFSQFGPPHLEIMKGGSFLCVERGRALALNESGRRQRWGFRLEMRGQKRISEPGEARVGRSLDLTLLRGFVYAASSATMSDKPH